LEQLEADPARLEWVQARIAKLKTLQRKYGRNGRSLDEVLTWAANAQAKLDILVNDDERIESLQGTLVALNESLATLAVRLSKGRAEAAQRLAAAVQEELSALAMPHARLEFALQPLAELGAWGAENVQLLFAANGGSALAPLAKVASGGELSRVRLALEVVLATPGHTFVFDEVDAGVGGAVGLEIGARLARLALHSQVIVVTHLAQVAVFADKQFVIAKSDDGEVTSSDIIEVSAGERVAEIARMLGGLSDSATALAHAEELLASARG
jgi:DNA repair protein RecN (Recombination protein N)